MTEDEAKTKWCPFVRLVAADQEQEKLVYSGNRLLDPDSGKIHTKGALCIASACMAWRWDIDKNRAGPDVDHGYCGLAGVPR